MKRKDSIVEGHRKAQPWLALLFVILLIGGWFFPPLGYFMIICMFAAMILGVIKGRYWCDWMCPRGSFLDTVVSRISRNKQVPKLFRHPIFRLGWLVLLMTMLALRLPPVWGDWYLMGKPFVVLLTMTTIIGVILGIIYHQRIWCMFCPMGTMANLLGRNKYQLLVNERCTGCGCCSRVCRMQINPGDYREDRVVQHGDCLKCSYCIEVCPCNALEFEGNRTNNKQQSVST